MPFTTFRIALLAGAMALAPLALPAGASTKEPELSGSYLAGRHAGTMRDAGIAAKYFAEALAGDPANPLLIERTFMLDLQAGNVASAEAFAGRVIEANSQHRMARMVLGLRAMREGKGEEARNHFKEAAYTPAGQLTSALLSAWSYAGDRNPVQAFATLDQLDGNESFANFKSYHIALIADQLGLVARAEQAYRQAYEALPGSLRLVQAYGNFLLRQGKREEALKIYAEFLGTADKNPLVLAAQAEANAESKPKPFAPAAMDGAGEALFSLASAFTGDQGLDMALAHTQLALSATPNSDVARTLLGDVYEDMSRYEDAVSAYDMVPETSPLRANAEIEIAVNLQRLERGQEGLTRLNTLIARDPQNFEAVFTLGNLQRVTDNHVGAVKAYTRAIEMTPDVSKNHWSLFYYRGIAYERLKQWPNAEADFRKALALDPDQALVLNYLGYSMIDQRINLQEAIQMVRRAVELKPNDGYIVDSLGWAHYQLGEYEEAVKHLERAVELKPADPIIADHLGDAYWRVGRKLEAKFQWQHSKDNKPEPTDLTRVVEKLKNGLEDEAPAKPAENTSGGGNG